MLTYETLGHMIIQELINIRKDFKIEIERLGDRLEKCLSFHEAQDNLPTNNETTVTDQNIVSTAFFNACADIEDSNFRSSNTAKVNENLESALTTVEVEVSDSEGFESATSGYPENVFTAAAKTEKDLDTSFPANFGSSAEKTVFEIPEAAYVNNQSNLTNIPPYSTSSVVDSLHKSFNEGNVKSSIQNQQSTTKKTPKLRRPTVKRFQCKICQKFFYTNNHLKTHLKIHLGVRSHACSYCSLAFMRKIDLDRHVRIHTGETPFSCDECGRKFRRNDCLIVHKRLHEKRRLAMALS